VDEVITAAQELSQLLCVLDESRKDAEAPASATHVSGAGRFSTQLASCCRPLEGDPIVGCLGMDNQVVVHKPDCPVALHYPLESHENFIEVQWGDGRRISMLVDLYILAYDRAGLLRDITTILADAGIEVMEVNTRTDRGSGTARMKLQVEVDSYPVLSRVLEKISRLNNIIEARRIAAGDGVDTIAAPEGAADINAQEPSTREQ
jgi:GTP pyrophosphokinase